MTPREVRNEDPYRDRYLVGRADERMDSSAEIQSMQAELSALRAKVERYEAKLKKYADHKEWASVHGVCDVFLPDGDGWELAEEALKEPGTGRAAL